MGVIVNDRLTATDQVNNLLSTSTGLLYALRVLSNHGIPTASLQGVFCATVILRITYCAPAWSGGCSAADIAHLQHFSADASDLATARRVCHQWMNYSAVRTTHFLNGSWLTLPTCYSRVCRIGLTNYSWRERSHNKTLITKTADLSERDFIIRMIYKNSY